MIIGTAIGCQVLNGVTPCPVMSAGSRVRSQDPVASQTALIVADVPLHVALKLSSMAVNTSLGNLDSMFVNVILFAILAISGESLKRR